MTKDIVEYEGFDYLKFVACGAETVADVVAALECTIKELKSKEPRACAISANACPGKSSISG
jgi:hypothetical protein